LRGRNAITQADENIRRIKAPLARLEVTTEGLKGEKSESARLMNESKVLLAIRVNEDARNKPLNLEDLMEEEELENQGNISASRGFEGRPALKRRRCHRRSGAGARRYR
jgi:hypothetical protein